MASEANSSSIVENWLRSVNLVQYTQAFLDNGYDDLEVCKQIGEEDLDAIGVPRDQHREKLLRAVKVLREEGGAAVYFTLEECDTCQSGDETEVDENNEEELCAGVVVATRGGGAYCLDGATQRLDAYDMGKTTLVTYPKVQLKLILRNKLVEDCIDLSCPPYTNPDLVVCGSSLTALAMRFAEELKTHFIDVLERLEELWMAARNNDVCSVMCKSPSRSVYTEEQNINYGYPPQQNFHYPGSPRSLPPPLPSCPPPATMSSTYIDKWSSLKPHLEGNHNRSDPLAHQNYAAVDGESASDDKKKGGSLFGRFFRNIGFRKSGRKGSYKQHQGDLSAYEISMSEEDRMALMILVKEGKISTQTALAVVQRFEEEKKTAVKTVVSDDGKENICDTPSKKGIGKKKKTTKPTKSQSTLSADDPQRCQLGSQSGLSLEHDQSCDHQMCRQRRVHSLGQLEIPQFRHHLDLPHDHQHDRIPATQTLSSIHPGTPSRKVTSQMEPPAAVRLHASSQQQLQHQLQPPHHVHHHHHHHHHSISKIDAITGKTLITVPKTSSKTSLLSSGSDQSMECGSQTQLRTDPLSRQVGDPTTYNSNSTVSMNSETNSPASGRKKSGSMLDPRIKNHRSASCSTGDDGISSENDDAENSSRRHVQTETVKAKVTFDTSRSRVREAIISRPPLLRQRSAPSGSPIFAGAYLGQAKVIVDYKPGPDEEDFVTLRKGEIVNIINMAQSGVWRGIVAGKRGKFRFEHVEVVPEPEKRTSNRLFTVQKDVPRSVGDLFQKIGLEQLTPVFMQNGYDDLDIFSELDEHDLDTLSIADVGQRAKLLSAARVLVDWHEKMNVHTPILTTMDSPSSRAGNSSCDSGCYAGGESKYHPRGQDATGGIKEGDKRTENIIGHHQNPAPHTPCRSCGKPKQPRKYCGPSVVTQYTPGQYPTQSQGTPGLVVHSAGPSPYTPGHFQYTEPQQCGQYSHGQYGYHYSTGSNLYSQGHSHHTMSVSKTLTELNVADRHTSSIYPETFMNRRPGSNSTSPVYADKLSVGSGRTGPSDKGSVGDRVSLTEEDQEVIAITYGTNQSRKLTTPVHSLSSGSSQLEMSNAAMCSACVPSGCQQCDESALCDSSSCQQCAAYVSCPQCFPYKHYINTTLRSESKSSKMSCSSACTQTTCLSPDHDDSSHSGGSVLIDYTSPPGGYYMSKSSPSKSQQYYCCQPQCLPHPFYHRTPTIPGTPTPKQLPSPVLIPISSPNTHPITLAFTDSKTPQGLALTLKPEGMSSPIPPTDWGSHSDENEAPGIATLYSRGRSLTPERVDRGDASQVKSPTRSLMPLVSTKLSAERIDLTKLPYSTVIGHCGIPPLLVQRYSEELRQDMGTMSLVLEQLREKQLRELGRPCIVNESLSESCKNACDLQISSIQNFLISIGLPMYQKSLTEGGIGTLEQLLKLKESELEQMTGADSRHLRRIAHALEWVQHKLASPSHKARATGVTDKV